MKVIWTAEAERDRLAIWHDIAAHDVNAAIRIDDLFADAVDRLADFPLLGHEGTLAGTREMTPHRRYRIVYEVSGGVVWILMVVHTARRWPPLQ